MKIDDVFIDVADYSTQKYIEYAVAVVADRALPYVHDGLKPVHRRILYAMTGLGIKSKEKPKKSARIVGDVIGKYHPHGDASVYNAMVALAQEWKMRYPLVASQGNFGSRDGDGAAAMRYTEAGITPFAEDVLLDEMREGTCDFVPNFDGTMSEVKLLPSKLNNLLLNGSFGIAVGMATKIPSHNIRELTDATLAYIDNKDITVPEIMEILKGPDFATGGQVITSREKILEAYEKGQGIIKIRCRWNVEKLARGQWRVVVTELPPDSNITKVLQAIDKITNPPVQKDSKGKNKPLKASVLKDKQFLTSILAKAENDSDSSGLRLILEPKSSKQDPEEFMNLLYSRIGLEESFGINLTMVDINKTPKRTNIKEYIEEWVDYRKEVLRRRLEFHLAKVQKRLHILEGRLKVYENLDKAIDIIKESEEPKEELMEFFDLSEQQAEDILEIKLRQLAKLEKDKLQKEYDKLKKEEEKYLRLLNSEARFISLMKKEIEETTVKYEDERRTLLEEATEAVAKSTDAIVEEPVTVIYTKQGWLTMRKGHNVDTSTVSFKDNDEPEKILEMKTTEQIAFLATNGRGYSIRPTEVPNGKNNFVHIKSLVDCGDANVVDVMVGNKDKLYVFSNSDSYGFVSHAENLVSKNKAGKHFMSLPNKNTTIFKALEINPDQGERLNILSSDYRLLSFDVKEVKQLDKGKGVQLIRLKDDSMSIIDVSLSPIEELPVLHGQKKKIYRDEELEPFNSSRARRGKVVPDNTTLSKD